MTTRKKARNLIAIILLSLCGSAIAQSQDKSLSRKLEIDPAKPTTIEVEISYQTTLHDNTALKKVILEHGFIPEVHVVSANGKVSSSSIIGRRTGIINDDEFNSFSSAITPLAEKSGGKITWKFIQKSDGRL